MLDLFSVDVLELVFHYRTVKFLNGGQIDFFAVAGNDDYLRLALYVALPFDPVPRVVGPTSQPPPPADVGPHNVGRMLPGAPFGDPPAPCCCQRSSSP